MDQRNAISRHGLLQQSGKPKRMPKSFMCIWRIRCEPQRLTEYGERVGAGRKPVRHLSKTTLPDQFGRPYPAETA